MQSGFPARRSPALFFLAILFIGSYFFFFSWDSLNAYFTFDDGMNLVHLHHLWEVPARTNVVDVLKVFTTAYRPLGGVIYRSMYSLFGFNPQPFRVLAYLLMIANIVLAYRFARALEANPEAAGLGTLLFCYNGSMVDLYYNFGTIYDLICFPLYIGAVVIYARGRAKQETPGWARMTVVMVLFLGALDAKELAATLPAVLLVYEALYRRASWRSSATALRTGGFLTAMFAASAGYLKIKVTELAGNTLYQTHVSVSSVLIGIGHYCEKLLYLPAGSCGAVTVVVALIGLMAIAVGLRSRAMAYGALFFVIGLLPLAVIAPREGYAAYVAYPGLTMVLGVILARARETAMRWVRRPDWETASRVVWFLGVAAVSVSAFGHTRKILNSNAEWDQGRRIDLLTEMKREIPEFPPNARILFTDDPFAPDWGPLFLTQLSYHDPTVWVDRVKNSVETGNRDSYDLLATYTGPLLVPVTTRVLGVRKSWEMHWAPQHEGEFTLAAANPERAIRDIGFSPSAARAGRTVTMTVPGLANVKIDAIYRIVSNGGTITRNVKEWCTLDAAGSCKVIAPHGGAVSVLTVDWVRPAAGRWIFTNGVATLVE